MKNEKELFHNNSEDILQEKITNNFRGGGILERFVVKEARFDYSGI